MQLVLILLSPAKSLDYESRVPTRKHTQPRMLDEAIALIEVMRAKAVDEVADLMSISLELAELNVRRYADFSTPFTMRNARQAAFAFDGDVYRGLDATRSMDGRDLAEAQKTIRILSGLYGVLRPLDLVQPYRLEMGTKVRTDRGETLYDWWGTRITDVLNADLTESPGPPVVVNLASGEYFRSVDTDRLDGTVISPRFLDEAADGEYRIVSFNAKWARGAMAGWMVRNRVRSARALRRFDVAGYRYDASRSTSAQPTFIRPRLQ
jgi:uncharacterized protein